MSRAMICLVAIGAMLSANASQAQLPTSYWQFNEGSGTTANDIFGTTDNGTLQNSATYGAPRTGTTGFSLNLTPDQANPGSTVLVNTTTFAGSAVANNTMTVSYWSNRAGVHTSDPSSSFWAPSPSLPGDTRGFQAHATWSDGNIYFDTAGCCTGTTQRLAFGAVGPATTVGTWNHFVFIKNGGAKQVYLNGTLIGSQASGANALAPFSQFWIGSAPSGNETFNGSIDDMAVFDRALSAAEITEIFSGSAALSVSTSSINFGRARAGGGATSPTAVTVGNSGALLSQLSGTISLGGADPSQFTLTGGGAYGVLYGNGTTFTPNEAVNPTVAFNAPVTRGSYTASMNVTSNAGPSSVSLSGQAVGPVFQANLDPMGANTPISSGGTINFGEVSTTSSIPLRITNATTDLNLDSLEDLTILSASILGPNAGQFQLLESDGVTPYTPGDVLDMGEFIDLVVRFNSDLDNGMKTAVLSFTTDQGAAVGQPGQVFSFNLLVSQIPEPTSIVLWSLLGLGVTAGFLRRYRRAR